MKEFPLNNKWNSRLTAIYAQKIIFDKYNIETKLKKSKNKRWELKDNERRPTKKFKKRENKKYPYRVKRKIKL